MALPAPTLDITQILKDLGQTITIRTVNRTINSDGAITAITNTDVDIIAQIQEVSYKEKLFLQMGIAQIGDIIYLVPPDTIINIYDKIIWNSDIYSIRKIIMPPRIGGILLYKQILTVRDTTNV